MTQSTLIRQSMIDILYLLIVYYYSKYPELVEVQGKTRETTLHVNVIKSVFARHGIPEKLVADNIPFNSAVFQWFAELWDFNDHIKSILPEVKWTS